MALGLVVGGLSIGILLLSLLVITSGPRVRHVVVQNRDDGEIASADQALTLVFDRPVKNTDFAPAVKLRPEADYTVSHRSQLLNITFDENLLSNTEYTLRISPKLEDESGKRMEREYTYRFTTAEASFTYLERNYDPGALDKVIERAPISKKRQVLFEALQIEYFGRNEDYLAVVLPKTKYTDELRVKNLETGRVEEIDVPGAVRVESLEFSPAEGQFVFVTRVIAGPGADESFRRGYDGRLYRYDIDGSRLQSVDTMSDEGNVESALYSRDGQALLYQTLDGTYFLTSATGTSQPSPLGSFAGSGGFNRTNTKLAFLTDNGAAIYNAQTRRLHKWPSSEVSGNFTAPTFLHNTDELVFLESLTDAETGSGTSRVSIVDAAGEDVEAQVRSEPSTYFFDPPVISYDDRYILVESSFASDAFDSYPGNPQPEHARLVLYDRSDHEVVEEIRGIDPVWSR